MHTKIIKKGLSLTALLAIAFSVGFWTTGNRLQAADNKDQKSKIVLPLLPVKSLPVVESVVLEDTKANFLKYGTDVENTYLSFLRTSFNKAVELYPDYLKKLLSKFTLKDCSEKRDMGDPIFVFACLLNRENLQKELQDALAKGKEDDRRIEIAHSLAGWEVGTAINYSSKYLLSWFLQQIKDKENDKHNDNSSTSVWSVILGWYSIDTPVDIYFTHLGFLLEEQIVSVFAQYVTTRSRTVQLVKYLHPKSYECNFRGGNGWNDPKCVAHVKGIEIDHVYKFKTDYSWVSPDPIVTVDSLLQLAETALLNNLCIWLPDYLPSAAKEFCPFTKSTK